jgi:glycosyltransferase involved in cell wall biosynthesis
VIFLGQLNEMPEFYRSIDLFVLPSIAAEGLPLAVLEAMASGLPTVATRVGGTAEAVLHGEQGFVVEPRDPTALAAALRHLLANGDVRKRLGESSRRRAVDELSTEQFGANVFDVYRSICEPTLH